MQFRIYKNEECFSLINLKINVVKLKKNMVISND